MQKEEIKRTVEIVDCVVFTAEDGTKFTAQSFSTQYPANEYIERAKEQCEKYEQTARCAYKKRFTEKFPCLKGNQYSCIDRLLDNGCSSSTYYLIPVKTEEDITLTYAFIKSETRDEPCVELEIGKTYFLCIGDEGEWHCIYSTEKMQEMLDIAINGEPEEKKEEENV